MILQNIPHIEYEYKKYYVKYCQSHITLLWNRIMPSIPEMDFVQSPLMLP